MCRLTSFTMLSLDGSYADANGDMDFAHLNDHEWNAFATGVVVSTYAPG